MHDVETVVSTLLGGAGLMEWGHLVLTHLHPRTVSELNDITITDLRRVYRLSGFSVDTEPSDEEYTSILKLLADAANTVDESVDAAWLRTALAGVQLVGGVLGDKYEGCHIALERRDPEPLLLGEELGLAAKLGVIPHGMCFHNIVA